MLLGTDQETTRVPAEKLCRTVESLGIGHTGSDKGVVTVSVGVATMASSNIFASSCELIAKDDAALYAAKASGRNMVKLGEAA